MRIGVDLAVIVLGLALLFKFWGKSALQSALLFAGILLVKDVVRKLFGTVGVGVYMGALALLFLGVYLTKKKGENR